MHSKSDNIEIMINDKAGEIMKKLFKSLKVRCQKNLDGLIQYKCLYCNKNYQLDEQLKEQFFNTYKFSNHDNNKFMFLSRKIVYPYDYMDDWKKFNETFLPEI